MFSEWINIYSLGGALSKVDELKKENYLKQHQSKIYYSESDKRWRTYVKNSEGRRKAVTSVTKEGLENKLVEYYAAEAGWDVRSGVTVNSLFPKFISYKAKETSLANANRLTWVYNKYYKDDPFSDRPLDEVKMPELKIFLLDKIEQCSLTSRKYKDMKSLLNMVYDFAVENELVEKNLARNIHNISYRKFAPAQVKSVSEQVFVGDEEKRVQECALRRFNETKNIAYLAICLNFALGLRVGELVALKYSDFEENYLHICRQEVQTYSMSDNGTTRKKGFEIVPYTKSVTSDRKIPVTTAARQVLALICQANAERNLEDEYIFIGKKGLRLHTRELNKCLERINTEIGTSQKGNHSIRKTCLSNMSASGMLTDEEIRMFAGHKDISTTQRCYIFATQETDKRLDAFEKAITPNMLSFEFEGVQGVQNPVK